MKPMILRALLGAVLVACSSFGHAAESAPVRPPNIVLILSDDCGYADFGFQDVVAPDIKGHTPALDKLAARGMVFSQAYVSGVVCSPSRAG